MRWNLGSSCIVHWFGYVAKCVIQIWCNQIRFWPNDSLPEDAGDAYRELSSAIMKIVPKDFMPKAMQKVGEALNWVIFNSHEKMLRNKHGEEQKQRELWQLEKKIADLVNEGFLTDYESLIGYLRIQYQKRNYPKVFANAG